MEGFGFGSYSKTWTPTLGIHLYIEGQGEGAGHTKATSLAAPIVAGSPQTLAPRSSTISRTLSEAPPDFSTATDTTPSSVDSRGATTSAARWNGEVDVVFINNRTCDRVRRCCPFVAPEPIVIKIFYALLQAANMASSINFNQFLEKEKLKSNGSNFTDWFRHVRIFLNGGNLQYVLDAPLGDPPAETETDEVKNVYMTRKTRYSQVQCAILCSLESDLQKRFEHHDPHELIKELKTIFETHAAVECYEASKHFFSCMMEEGSSISEHMLVMTGHAKKLSDLGIVIPNRLGINRVLQSLPPSYKNFVMNYNMQNMNKEFPELFGMLKAAEIEIKKEHQVLMVNKTTSFKKQGKSKGKNKKSGKKAATPPVKPKSGPKPDAECYYCKEKGHWKRNCSKYLADLKSGLIKKKKEGMEHWTAVKNILKYLKRTKDMFLCYGGDQELVVTSYTDASWNTDPDDSKSQSGYVFILNGAAVSWASSKQCTVAKSSTESEYIAASEASSEAVWMKRFIVELGVVPSALDPFVIYCDNMGAIANAQEPRSHKRLKHIKLRYHSIREYIEDGEVKICKVHTDLNVADPLTKALPRAKHDQHQNAMGVRYITM
ncbi:hypothetical protein QYE76_052692 [Lolium multiflorum]|uniref:CCHC-type domain-containing protein n=2 Tax=Lolium multiflorum TaxID=4521 RepID=A0AAD8SW30_LOLMU|nr:hypothetical protein QYE76_052692 [Lolium multiflorum]